VFGRCEEEEGRRGLKSGGLFGQEEEVGCLDRRRRLPVLGGGAVRCWRGAPLVLSPFVFSASSS